MERSNTKWSKESYGFNEIAKKFKFPLLVQVSEGFYRETETDSFAAGDVLLLDQYATLQKVAARFVELPSRPVEDSGNEPLKEEILIPLNYKGKLKVQNEIKIYNTVQKLGDDFPRYAVVLETLSVLEGGQIINIPIGSDVELDRVIPPQKPGRPGYLVINTQIEGNRQVKVNLDQACKIRSMPDTNEYTLREAVDRYCLPQFVSFLDNKIASIYTQDLIEGVEQMVNVTTSVLQIKSIVQQNVLIGRYKEPDLTVNDSGHESGTYSTRTLVVLPLDSKHVREILVNVYKGDIARSKYEELIEKDVNADKRRSIEMAEGLYREFLKTPHLIKLPELPFEDNEDDSSMEKPPPLPPRPERTDTNNLVPIPRSPRISAKPKEASPKARKKSLTTFKLPPPPRTTTSPVQLEYTSTLADLASCHSYGNVEFSTDQAKGQTGAPSKQDKKTNSAVSGKSIKYQPLPDPPVKTSSSAKSTDDNYETKRYHPYDEPDVWLTESDKSCENAAAANFIKSVPPRIAPITEHFRFEHPDDLTNITDKNNSYIDMSGSKPKDPNKQVDNPNWAKRLDLYEGQEPHCIDDTDNSLNKSDKTSENSAACRVIKAVPCKPNQPTEQIDNLSSIADKNDSYVLMSRPEPSHQTKDSKPVAHITPHSSRPSSAAKEFRLLSVVEVRERLISCGMEEFGNFCFKEKINGAFLVEMDQATLSSLELTPFQQKKLVKIMSGWIPT